MSKIVGSQEINHSTFMDALENILRYAREVKDEPQFIDVIQVPNTVVHNDDSNLIIPNL